MAESARQVDTAKAAPDRTPAGPNAPGPVPEGPHGRLLALQQAAGNRAVAALLQRQDGEGAPGGYHPQIRLLDEQLRLDPSLTRETPQAAFDRRLGTLLYPDSIRRSLYSIPFQDHPAWLPQAGEQPSGGAEQPAVPAGAGPAEARPAGAGDAFRAVMAIPAVDSALNTLRGQASERVGRDWGRLSGGERGLVITSAATIGGAALAGVLSDQKSREFMLQQLHGRDLPIPGVDGLNVQFRTQKEDLGVSFSFDVGRHLPSSWGFGRR